MADSGNAAIVAVVHTVDAVDVVDRRVLKVGQPLPRSRSPASRRRRSSLLTCPEVDRFPAGGSVTRRSEPSRKTMVATAGRLGKGLVHLDTPEACGNVCANRAASCNRCAAMRVPATAQARMLYG